MKKRNAKENGMKRALLLFGMLALLGLVLLPGISAGARVIDVEPEDGATDVKTETWITIRFNESMDTASVEEGLSISPSLKPFGYRVDWSNDDKQLTIKPNTAFDPEEEYTISIDDAEDEMGQPLDDFEVSFETEKAPGLFDGIKDMPSKAWNGFIGILPNIVMLIVMLIFGYIVAKVASWIFTKAMKKMGFDRAMDKVGMGAQLRSFGIDSSSKFLGVFIFWFIFAIFLQITVSRFGVPGITDIIAPIVLFIPRILMAAIVVFIGLYVSNLVANKFMEIIGKTAIGKELKDVEKTTAKSGISLIKIISLFIKIFILLIFVMIALDIVNIGLLSEIITPIVLLLPLILVAMFIVLIGIIFSRFVVKTVLRLFREFEIQKLIRPVEETIGKKGIVLRILGFIIQLMVMLIFIQMAVGVLNSTGAFDQLAELINMVILWLPNVFAALFVLLLGFWFAGWVQKKYMSSTEGQDIPFRASIGNAIKMFIIYLAGVMAIAQLGFEVPILYIVTAIVLGAAAIGLGAGFAFGAKDVFANVGGYIHGNKVLKVGSKVKIDDKYSGKVVDINYYTTTLKTKDGDKILIPNSMLTKSVVVEES